jgi:hypothetical protein
MLNYFKRKAPEQDGANHLKSLCLAEINWEEEIKYDPGLRKEIDSYHPNLREKVRRKYLENGPCNLARAISPLHRLKKLKTQEGLF